MENTVKLKNVIRAFKNNGFEVISKVEKNGKVNKVFMKDVDLIVAITKISKHETEVRYAKQEVFYDWVHADAVVQVTTETELSNLMKNVMSYTERRDPQEEHYEHLKEYMNYLDYAMLLITDNLKAKSKSKRYDYEETGNTYHKGAYEATNTALNLLKKYFYHNAEFQYFKNGLREERED